MLDKSEQPRYAISSEEFRSYRGPIIPHYTMGRDVSRANVTAFWKDGFTKSRGKRTGQYIHRLWVELRTGYDNTTTGKNYFHAGGWDILRSEEKFILYNDYRRIAKKEPQHNLQSIGSFGEEFDKQLKELFWPRYSIGSLDSVDLTRAQLASLSAQQVLTLISEYARKYKAGEVF